MTNAGCCLTATSVGLAHARLKVEPCHCLSSQGVYAGSCQGSVLYFQGWRVGSNQQLSVYNPPHTWYINLLEGLLSIALDSLQHSAVDRCILYFL